MKGLRLAAVLTAAFSTCFSAASWRIIDGSGTNGTPFTQGDASAAPAGPGGYLVHLNAFQASFGINLPSGTDWTGASHVVVQVQNVGTTSAMVFIGIDSGTPGTDASWIWSDTMVPPGKVITLATPFQRPVGLGIRSWPSLTDTSLTQGICSGQIVPANVRRLIVWNFDPQGPVAFQITRAYAANIPENTTSVVDQYGQQTINFPGKVTSDAQLQAQIGLDALYSGNYPFTSDRFGGAAGTAVSLGTGQWRTAKQGGRWYILDPSGNRFFSAGVVAPGWQHSTVVQNRPSFFAAGALPSQTGPFAEHYSTSLDPNGVPTLCYDFYSSNLQRKFGTNWQLAASQDIIRRMRTWGFNTELYASLSRPTGFVNCPVFGIDGTFSRIPMLNGWAPMPDVYDAAWVPAVHSTLQAAIPGLLTDSMNMGVFVDNELAWADSPANPTARYLLPLSILDSPPTQPAKVLFISNLTTQYQTIANLNAAWSTSFSSWADLLSNQSFNPVNINTALAADLNAFTAQFAQRYFSQIRAELNALNYKGLYLGCRFLYYTPDVAAAAKLQADVLSFNIYETTPSRYHEDLKTLDCPIMVGEFGFGACDAGRVCGYNPNAASEIDQVSLYQAYIADGLAWPNMVGLHWCIWEDCPASGRTWDGEVFGVGLVSVTDMPHPLLDAAIQKGNTAFHKLLFVGKPIYSHVPTQ